MLHRIIRERGKRFVDLTLDEVALMIEADSALCPDGNEMFSGCALDEFLITQEFEGRADLDQIRDEINAEIYVDIPGEKRKAINVEFLKRYASSLRRRANSNLK